MIVPEDCPGVSCDCEPTPPTPAVECTPVLYSDERPSITEKTIAWFSSGATFPAGDYKVEYVNGALKYNASNDWQLNESPAHGYYVTYNNGTSNINAPGDMAEYVAQVDLEAANAGAFVTFHHSGGMIGVYLFDDPYGDNTGGSPNPTFRLRKVCDITPPPQYCNDEQTYTAECPEGLCGDPVTVTIEENTYCSPISKEAANALALTAAMEQANQQLDCEDCDECQPEDYDIVTPSIEGVATSNFSSGIYWPAGYYKISYVGGALKYNGSFDWGLNDSTSHRFVVSYNDGANDVDAPSLDYNRFSTQAALESHNAGSEVIVTHTGGMIGVRLVDNPYSDNVAGAPNPSFQLSRVCTPPPECADSPSVESVMRALQERQIQVTGVAVTWLNRTNAGTEDPPLALTPTPDYPPDGFFDGDTTDTLRAAQVTDISSNWDDTWLNADTYTSYVVTNVWEGLASLVEIDTTLYPPPVVTEGNWETSLETLADYCCELETLAVIPNMYSSESRYGESAFVASCAGAKAAAAAEWLLSTWVPAGVGFGDYEEATYDAGSVEWKYTLRRERFWSRFDLSLIPTGGTTSVYVALGQNGADTLAHTGNAPVAVDDLFHQVGGSPQLGEVAWDCPKINDSETAMTCELGCAPPGNFQTGGWKAITDIMVQVYKSNNPSLGHWTYYP